MNLKGTEMPSNLLIGMNIHRWGPPCFSYDKSVFEQNIDTCKSMGTEIIRYNNSFRGENALSDVLLVADEIKKRDMKIMLVIDDCKWQDREITGEIGDLSAYYEEYMFNIASSLKGRIDIYQVFNEMDVAAMHGDIANIILPGKDGREKGEYDCVLWKRAAAAVKGALKGIKKGDPDAKTSINFSWWHTALIYELYNEGCRWDITGIDWYSDCEEVSSIESLIKDLRANIPKSDLMICETNFWMHPMKRDPEEKREALKDRETRNEDQAAWVDGFIDKLVGLEEPKLKAVIFYELLDESFFERNKGGYYGESHFGFIECNENGGNQVKKPAFYTLERKTKELKNKR